MYFQNIVYITNIIYSRHIYFIYNTFICKDKTTNRKYVLQGFVSDQPKNELKYK